MIVCSCNVLSNHDVRHAVNFADNYPRNAKEIFGCLGCSVECGRCARTIRGLIDDALASCDNARKLGSSMEESAKAGRRSQHQRRATIVYSTLALDAYQA